MKKLSLCMIVKNEEKTLAKALENAKVFADEIVIVDTGSTDKTKDVAKNFTDKVYDFEWIGDFSKARNYSFSLATLPYIMWLDGDDIVPEESAKNILKWKNEETDEDVLMCPYVASFDENFTPIFYYLRERIVKNDKSLRWTDRVHEVIVPKGKVKTNNDIKIFHANKDEKRSNRNLLIYKQMIEDGETLSPRAEFYYARELYFNDCIDEAIHQFSKFLSDGRGWRENNIEACLNLGRCYLVKKNYNNALTSLFGSFVYDLPKSEVLYEIGNVYFNKSDFRSAIYWYELALDKTSRIEEGGFVNLDTSTILPALQLCVCYDKIGNLEKAFHFHEVSKAFNPNDKAVLNNQKYFDNLFKNE